MASDDCCGGCTDCGNACYGTSKCCGEGLFGFCDPFGRHRTQYDRHQRFSLADKHAPAGLMGGHVHEQGEIMVEYKYMHMRMDGNRAGTLDIPNAAAFDFPVNGVNTNAQAIPLNMTMHMHMMHIMYGLTDDVTLYIMPMITSLEMDHLRDTPFGTPLGPMPALAGQPFTTENTALDDLVLGALWRAYAGERDEIILNFGFSVPTGDIDRQTTAPFGAPIDFPYPMRIGSGTVDARPGITYKNLQDHGSFGIQYQADLSLGNNDQGYAVGDEHRLNVWYSWLPCDRLSFSFRVENLWRNNYDGADFDQTAASQAFISTNRSDSRGGFWTNLGYGGSMLIGDGYLANFELVHPVVQDLEGIQLKQELTVFASISKAF